MVAERCLRRRARPASVGRVRLVPVCARGGLRRRDLLGGRPSALSLTTKWRVNWSAHYDLEAQEIASQEYVIHRDLHCWEAQLVGRYYAEEWQYYLPDPT